ncbi:MAG TPA: hypothetical protein VKU41_03450 [Polyangiaceae bacterium]|nr:hypothetical protein [Polyangiaceae bacterium]
MHDYVQVALDRPTFVGAVPFRAEHVGTLIRPPVLVNARKRFQRGKLDAGSLRALEDHAVRRAVRFQEEVGIRGITDGGLRRADPHLDFLNALLREGGPGEPTRWIAQRPDPDSAALCVTGRVEHVAPIRLHDFAFLRSVTQAVPKVTMPSPTSLYTPGARDAISVTAYPCLDAFFDDVARAYRAELRALAGAGCRYVQMDDMRLASLADAALRESEDSGMDAPGAMLLRYVRLINAAISERPPSMMVSLRLCCGRVDGPWLRGKGFEGMTDALFGALDVDAYLLEYAGPDDFSGLRFVPHDKRVVLGIADAKDVTPAGRDDLKGRIERAAKFVPPERLGLSPRRGFSTSAGHSWAEQSAILRLVVSVASEVWGRV